MATIDSRLLPERHNEVPGNERGPPLGLPAVALSVVLATALVHPSALVLPTLSVILVIAGIVLAIVTWLRFRQLGDGIADKMTLPGLLVFVGFAAGILSDPDAAVQSMMRLP